MGRDRSGIGVRLGSAVLGLAALSGCAVPPAASEPVPPRDETTVLAVDQVAGFWSLRGPDGARCEVALGNLIIDGVRPVRTETCAVSAVTKGRSWRAMVGGFEILDSAGTVVMGFRRTGEDGFVSTSGGFVLSRAPLF